MEVTDPTDPGYDVATLREHVRHLERRIRELHAERAPIKQEMPEALSDEQVEPLFRAVRSMPGPGKDEWFWFAWGVEMAERAHGIRTEPSKHAAIERAVIAQKGKGEN